MNVRRNEEVGKLQRDVQQRVQAYASAQKFDLVVADAIYFSNAIDLTPAILAELQKGADSQRAAAVNSERRPRSMRHR